MKVYLKFDELANYRKDGYINLNCVINKNELEREVRGNDARNKNWFNLNDGRGMFKANEPEHDYSHYSELICSELAKQIGVEVAEYDIATFDGEKGVITKDMCKEGEELLSIHDLIGLNPNDNPNYPDSVDIEWVFDALERKFEKDGYDSHDIDKCMLDLRKQLLFDIFVMENDRHTGNVSFIVGNNGENKPSIRLSPKYDTEEALVLYSDKEHMKKIYTDILLTSDVTNIQEPKMCVIPEDKTIEESKDLGVLSLIEKLQASVNTKDYYSTESEEIWKTTLDYLAEDDRAFEFVETHLTKMNIDEAIKSVESKINSQIPEDIKKMAIACFNERKAAVEYELGLDLVDPNKAENEKNKDIELT